LPKARSSSQIVKGAHVVQIHTFNAAAQPLTAFPVRFLTQGKYHKTILESIYAAEKKIEKIISDS